MRASLSLHLKKRFICFGPVWNTWSNRWLLKQWIIYGIFLSQVKLKSFLAILLEISLEAVMEENKLWTWNRKPWRWDGVINHGYNLTKRGKVISILCRQERESAVYFVSSPRSYYQTWSMNELALCFCYFNTEVKWHGVHQAA